MSVSASAAAAAFVHDLQWRGFLHQATDLEGLQTALGQATGQAFYIGFDATADSLHVGSLMGIMLARLAQSHGLKPLMLMGGGTTKVGDPSGKTEARQLLDDATINANIQAIAQCFTAYLHFDGRPQGAEIINNATWLDNLNYITMLRDVGRHFSVNRMMGMDSVKLRLDREQPLSFLEFNYMVLQAYDFYWLHQHKACRLQCGGSDQWGNIVMGVDLIRRMTGEAAYGLTTPLMMTAQGEKMGKTHAGAVWLNPHKLSAFDYWQYWRNCADADVVRFLKVYTDLPADAIAPYAQATGQDLNAGKILLANAATALLHGESAVQAAQATVASVFGGGTGIKSGAEENLEDLQVTGWAPDGTPCTTTSLPAVGAPAQGLALVEALKALGFTTSLGEGRRLVAGGGVRVMNAQVKDEGMHLDAHHANTHGVIKISAGKKRHGLVVLKL